MLEKNLVVRLSRSTVWWKCTQIYAEQRTHSTGTRKKKNRVHTRLVHEKRRKGYILDRYRGKGAGYILDRSVSYTHLTLPTMAVV